MLSAEKGRDDLIYLSLRGYISTEGDTEVEG
jgi:hypothetical protein